MYLSKMTSKTMQVSWTARSTFPGQRPQQRHLPFQMRQCRVGMAHCRMTTRRLRLLPPPAATRALETPSQAKRTRPGTRPSTRRGGSAISNLLFCYSLSFCVQVHGYFVSISLSLSPHFLCTLTHISLWYQCFGVWMGKARSTTTNNDSNNNKQSSTTTTMTFSIAHMLFRRTPTRTLHPSISFFSSVGQFLLSSF